MGDSRKYPFTIPRVASWNCKGKRGFLDWNLENMEGNTVWNSKRIGGGVSALNFQRGKMVKASL